MMGRRKRGVDINKTPPPSDFIQYVERQLKQKSSCRPESSATQHSPPIIDVTGSSPARPQGHQSPQNHDSSHGILRHSHHYLDHHYSRPGSINHTDASPSNWKECREMPFHKLKRIRARSLASNAESSYTRKMECGICQTRFRRKHFNFENSNSYSEHSVVGVLVCGHVYHVDCLERKTVPEDMHDPPCPMCKHQL